VVVVDAAVVEVDVDGTVVLVVDALEVVVARGTDVEAFVAESPPLHAPTASTNATRHAHNQANDLDTSTRAS
jgi:hypothetical protein